MPAAARPVATSPATDSGSPPRAAGRGASALPATSLPSAPASASAPQAASTAPARVASCGLANRDALRAGDRLGDADGVEDGAVVEAQELGAGGDGERGGGCGRPLAALGRLAILPGPGQDGAQEVLPRKREVQRTAERAKLVESAEDLEVVVDGEVEVEPRIDGDLLRGDAGRERGLDPRGEPGADLGDGVGAGPRLALGPRRALDVHEDVAAAGVGDELEERRVRRAGGVVDGEGAGVERGGRGGRGEGVGDHRDTRFSPETLHGGDNG